VGVQRFCKECRRQNPLRIRKRRKRRKDRVLIRATRLQVEEFAGRKEQQRLEPLKDWNSSKSGKKAQQLRRSDNSRQIGLKKRSGLSSSSRPGRCTGERTGQMI
jgi:hypothetical protein